MAITFRKFIRRAFKSKRRKKRRRKLLRRRPPGIVRIARAIAPPTYIRLRTPRKVMKRAREERVREVTKGIFNGAIKPKNNNKNRDMWY